MRGQDESRVRGGFDGGIPAMFMGARVTDVSEVLFPHTVNGAFLAGGIQGREGCGWVHLVQLEAHML